MVANGRLGRKNPPNWPLRISDATPDESRLYAELSGDNELATVGPRETAEFRFCPPETIHRCHVKVAYALIVGGTEKAQPLRTVRNTEEAGTPEPQARGLDPFPQRNRRQRHDLPISEGVRGSEARPKSRGIRL